VKIPEPSGAQAILVLKKIDVFNYKRDTVPDGVFVLLCDYEDLDQTNPLIKSLREKNQLVPNRILVKAPHANYRYFLTNNDLITECSLDYLHVFSQFCCFLGATEVKVSNVSSATITNEKSGDAGVAIKHGGKISASIVGSESYEKIINFHDTFEPSEPNFAEAEKIKDQLAWDAILDKIFNLIKQGKKIKGSKYDISCSKEISNVINIAAKIKPYPGIDIDLGFTSNTSLKEKFSMCVEINF
jgi:hypothetical protein